MCSCAMLTRSGDVWRTSVPTGTCLYHAASLYNHSSAHKFDQTWAIVAVFLRLAPLSQGRIEPSDSTLMCSYHGWRFNGQGQAVSIPQAHFQSPTAEQAACNSNRSCVKAYPTQARPVISLSDCVLMSLMSHSAEILYYSSC